MRSESDAHIYNGLAAQVQANTCDYTNYFPHAFRHYLPHYFPQYFPRYFPRSLLLPWLAALAWVSLIDGVAEIVPCPCGVSGRSGSIR